MIIIHLCIVLFGLTLAESRNVGIVDGTDANIADHPWMVGLFIDDYFFCGGFLISPSWVLTAGHCGRNNSNKIHAGSALLNHSNALIINVAEIHVHPNFTQQSDKSPINDLSLLRLDSPANGTNIAPIGLPEAYSMVPDGSFVNITGWGFTGAHMANTTNILQTAKVVVTPFERCKKAYEIFGFNVQEEQEFCIGTIGEARGSCRGDSGGPAEINGTSIGIVSWGYNACSTSGLPGVFVRVSNYIEWIQEITGI